jgi:hypothetical protein
MRLDYLLAAIGIGAAAAFVSSAKAPIAQKSTPSRAKTTTSSGSAVMAVSKGGTATSPTTTTASEPTMYGFIDSWNGSELFEEPGTSFNWALDSGKGPIVRFYDKEYLGRYIGEQGGKVYQFEATSKTGKKVRFWVPKSEVKLMDAAGRDKYLLGEGETPAPERYTKLINFFYS